MSVVDELLPIDTLDADAVVVDADVQPIKVRRDIDRDLRALGVDLGIPERLGQDAGHLVPHQWAGGLDPRLDVEPRAAVRNEALPEDLGERLRVLTRAEVTSPGPPFALVESAGPWSLYARWRGARSAVINPGR